MSALTSDVDIGLHSIRRHVQRFLSSLRQISFMFPVAHDFKVDPADQFRTQRVGGSLRPSSVAKVLTFDPSDTIPTSTTGNRSDRGNLIGSEKAEYLRSSNATPLAIAALEANMIFRHQSVRFDPRNLIDQAASSVRFKIDIRQVHYRR